MTTLDSLSIWASNWLKNLELKFQEEINKWPLSER